MKALLATDIERLENTSFASAFGGAGDAPGADPTEGVVCIQSVACEISNQCSNACINTSIITVVTNLVGSNDGCGVTISHLDECLQSIICTLEVV